MKTREKIAGCHVTIAPHDDVERREKSMEWVDKSEAKRIIQLLKQRGVSPRCTVCDQADMKVMSYYIGLLMTNSITENIQIEGAIATTCAAMVCTNCGYVRLHSLQELGVTPQP